MASNKKSSNTSKTAHVMNLLSKNRNAAPETEASASEAAAAEQQPQSAPQPAVPSLISSLNADSEISSQIKSALAESLDTETPTAKEQSAPETAEAAPATEQPAVSETLKETGEELSAAEGSVDPEEISPASDEQPTAAISASESTEPPATKAAPATESTIEYINVMQTLVEEKAKKYMEMSGLCTCDRCVADVKALALNGLMPKYVVMNSGEMIPRITLYDGRFSADVTSQLLRACETVKKRPHHHR